MNFKNKKGNESENKIEYKETDKTRQKDKNR
jgi:hypothetical protein